MSTFLRAFKLTFGRFRWEILAYWIFSIGLVTGFSTGLLRQPPFPEFGKPFRAPPDWAKLEVLAACWIILRLMFSEPVFRTQGGWRSRPISRDVAVLTPYVVLIAVLLPSLLVRIFFIARETTPAAAQWWRLFRDYFLWGMLLLAVGAMVLRLAGSLLQGRRKGLAGKIVFAGTGLLVIGSWFHPKTAGMFFNTTHLHANHVRKGQDRSYGDLLPGLREVLPADARLLEPQGAPYKKEVPHTREVVRLAPMEGTVARGAGMSVEVTRVSPKGQRVEIEMAINLIKSGGMNDLPGGAMLLRFPGEIYSFRQQISDMGTAYPISCFPLGKLRCTGTFSAPMANPDWDELLPGLEVIIYRQDYDSPLITGYDGEMPEEVKVETPRPSPPPLPPGVEGDVVAVFNDFDFDWHGQRRQATRTKADMIPREGIPHVLARHPWSDMAWVDFVKPFLLKHAVESDKEILLERMTTEPRLGEIFIAKGWTKEAMPLLKRFAKERLPMDTTMVKALLEERDPALAADVAALATRLETDAGELEPLLRDYPGLDWQAFVHDGWMRRKYSFRLPGPVHPFPLWAAQLGDPSAFRYVAEKAARGEKGYKEHLASLLGEEHTDPIDYVRINLNAMRFDPVTGKWTS